MTESYVELVDRNNDTCGEIDQPKDGQTESGQMSASSGPSTTNPSWVQHGEIQFLDSPVSARKIGYNILIIIFFGFRCVN